MAARRRILILHNPTAGRGGTMLVDAVVRALTAAGASVTLAAPPSADAAAALAAETDAEAVGIAGGDGTLRAIAPALAGSGVGFAILPTGTGNILALETRAPRRAEAIAHTLLTGVAAPIPWGRANDAPFLVVAGVGLAGAAAHHAAAWKAPLGRAAYWAGIARAAIEGARLEVEVDGARHAAEWALVTAARLRPRRLAPQLTLALFSGGPALRPLQLAAVAASRLGAAPGVTLTAFSRATISADRPSHVSLDGEPAGATPVTFTSEAAPLLLLRPAVAA